MPEVGTAGGGPEWQVAGVLKPKPGPGDWRRACAPAAVRRSLHRPRCSGPSQRACGAGQGQGGRRTPTRVTAPPRQNRGHLKLPPVGLARAPVSRRCVRAGSSRASGLQPAVVSEARAPLRGSARVPCAKLGAPVLLRAPAAICLRHSNLRVSRLACAPPLLAVRCSHCAHVCATRKRLGLKQAGAQLPGASRRPAHLGACPFQQRCDSPCRITGQWAAQPRAPRMRKSVRITVVGVCGPGSASARIVIA